MEKNDEEVKLLENFKEFCNSLSRIKNMDLYLSYVLYLSKKYDYDYKKYDRLVACFDNYGNYLGHKPTGLYSLARHIEKDSRLTKDEHDILQDVLNKMKQVFNALANELEHTATLDYFIDKISSDDIKYYILEKRNYNMNIEVERLQYFADVSFKHINSSDKPLVCTDNDFIVQFLLDNEIACDILFSDSEDITIYKIKICLLGITDKIKITLGDIISNDIFNTKYRKIVNCYIRKLNVSNAKINKISYDKDNLIGLSSQPSISNDYFYINNSFKYLDKNGKIICLMADGTLSKIADTEIKKELVRKGLLEEIRMLPTIKDNLNLVVFSFCNKKISFIDDKNCSLICLKNPNKKAIIDTSSINNEYDLRVKKALNYNLIEYYNPIQLSDLIENCYRGCQLSFTNFLGVEGQYELLMVSNIEDGIISDDLAKFNYEKTKIEKYILQTGDVLISSHGTQIKIAVIDNIEDRKIIPNGNFLVIRINQKKLNPYYLEAYLNSKTGREILSDISTGTKNHIINQHNVKKIIISMLDIEKQNQLAEKIKNKKNEIKYTKKYLSRIQEECKNFFENEILEEFDINGI